MEPFEAVYRQHATAVFRYALKCVGRHDVAEDLAAEAFLQLHRHFDRVRIEELPGWLYVVVRNRSIDYWRRKAVEHRYFGPSPATEPAAPETAPFDPWWLGIAGLKPIHRACLHMRYVYDLDQADIARRLGLTEIQVKGHLQYASELLRKKLVAEAQ